MSKIVAIHSFRRSAGRSNLVANLAVLLAKQGRRVGVLDVDFQSPSLHLLFGVKLDSSQMKLNNYLRGECQVETVCHDISQDMGVKPPAQIIFLPASPDAADIAQMLRTSYPSEQLDNALQELEEKYALDFLLLDTAAGLSEETLTPIALANALIVLMRPDQQDYQGTAVVLEVAGSLGVPHNSLVLTYTPGEFDADKLVQELEATYSCRVGALLPYSEKLSTMASRRILALHDPGDAYIKEALRLVSWLKMQ
ncbi:MinD/ParA family protein [Chloroflexota bacterium]